MHPYINFFFQNFADISLQVKILAPFRATYFKEDILKEVKYEYNDVPGHPLSTVVEEGSDAALAPVN